MIDHEKKLARLRHEKHLMMQDMARPGFQLIMTKLNQAADEMLPKYDGLDFASDIGRSKAMRIQVFREVVNEIIPGMLETMMNVDLEPGKKWNFKKWLGSVRECIEEFLCNEWLKKARRLFHLAES